MAELMVCLKTAVDISSLAMHLINDILKPYAELETSIQQLMTELFSETCGMCTACCCRADICEEAGESAFLSLLLEQQELSTDDMDDRFGWLELHGCSLEYGRPPVCYIYFCDELLARLPDDESRHVAKTLGRLMNHIGQNAIGEWHLVEIMDAADLEKVDPTPLSRRMEEAQTAFDVIEEYVQTGRLSADGRGILGIISTDDP
ncbi:MAG: hypothetical protein ABFR33_00105 [Verrucomicrobiota bacterium]